MDTPRRRRSPLAVVVLALLDEAPMHVYSMHRLIRERAKDDVVNVGSRNSLHQAVDRLVRDGLVEVRERVADARGRTVYALTEAGRATLDEWTAEMLEVPRNEFPEFPAALSLAARLGPERLATHLERRVARLEEELVGPTPEQMAHDLGLHRVFLVEDEYRRAVLEAELTWVRAVVAQLRSGELAWGPDVATAPD